MPSFVEKDVTTIVLALGSASGPTAELRKNIRWVLNLFKILQPVSTVYGIWMTEINSNPLTINKTKYLYNNYT